MLISLVLFECHISIGYHVVVMHAFWTTVLNWTSYRCHTCSLDKSAQFDNILMTCMLFLWTTVLNWTSCLSHICSLVDSSQVDIVRLSCMLFG